MRLNHHKYIIFVVIYLISIELVRIACQQSASEQSQELIKVTSLQIQNFRKRISSISLQGRWQCIDGYLYESSQKCQYFKIPKNSSLQINKKQSNQSQSFFNNTFNGSVEAYFWTSQNSSDNLYFVMYRQLYKDKQIIQFNIDLKQADYFKQQKQSNKSKLVLFRKKKLITTVRLYEQQHELVKLDISVQIQINLPQESYSLFKLQPFGQQKNISIMLISQSINFRLTLHQQTFPNILYFFLIISLILFSSTLYFKIISKDNFQKRKIMFRISQWYVFHLVVFQFFVTILYFRIGADYYDTSLGYMVYLAFFNLATMLLIISNYQIVIAKFLTIKMILKMTTFFIITILFLFLALQFKVLWVFQIAIMMQWQIYHSITHGGKGGLPIDLIIFTIVCKLPIIYILTIKQNIYRSSPMDTNQFMLFCIVYIIHCIIIQLQSIKGGRFMIPNSLIPDYYNYYYTKDSLDDMMKDDCPICYVAMNKQPDSIVQLTQVQISSNNIANKDISSSSITVNTENQTKIKFMKTPCNHIFHIKCLTDWMQEKLVCPNCRSTLPQLASLQKE